MERGDDVTSFNSGAAELDTWLHRYAWENLRANNAITYVTTVDKRVVGYYAIASGSVALTSVPPTLRKGSRPDPMPVIVLARLAVDHEARGSGIGAGLLRDALERVAVLSESLGAAALLVHARDSAAREFYRHNGDFLPSPIDELQLLAPMKALRAEFLP
ncbi:GNAT superfamily N-acetyltransferase [Flexivirga oryzae]|uniref:GNAT superfamily N-acetyltransferase n=1 Tax=Flexivirga oryzae TaxID=1794944 RepID=A0A839N1K1_9MICO|nr:GNAT family N-acetyltransferase [Flexivirga oryzae]MBB2890669.1 GNAT superfamily N-acetyltransferase [Flexivirga oryzae]